MPAKITHRGRNTRSSSLSPSETRNLMSVPASPSTAPTSISTTPEHEGTPLPLRPSHGQLQIRITEPSAARRHKKQSPAPTEKQTKKQILRPVYKPKAKTERLILHGPCPLALDEDDKYIMMRNLCRGEKDELDTATNRVGKPGRSYSPATLMKMHDEYVQDKMELDAYTIKRQEEIIAYYVARTERTLKRLYASNEALNALSLQLSSM